MGVHVFFLVEAYRYGKLAAVAPFRYTQIIRTIFAGWIVWVEIPSTAVFTGIGIICTSGVFITWREALAKKRSRQLAAADQLDSNIEDTHF